MTPQEFAGVYRQVAEVSSLHGETDLNGACIGAILDAIHGTTVLEVGCGRGYLAKMLQERWEVTATDIVIDPLLRRRHPNVHFVEASSEFLPCPDRAFDTVICTHTLEHVRDIHLSIAELRRVSKRRLIIVVPKQRPYQLTLNLHLHFFPYSWSVYSVFGHRSNSGLKDLGDWFYWEDTIHRTPGE